MQSEERATYNVEGQPAHAPPAAINPCNHAPGEPLEEQPNLPGVEAPERRKYFATVFGAYFVVDALNRENVEAHLVRRLREEIAISLATFDDGQFANENGILVEVASVRTRAPGGDA